MRPADNTDKLFKKLRLKASTHLNERVHGDILKALEKSTKTKSAALQPNVWRTMMKSIVARKKVAVLCCIALVSVAAAVVGPSVYYSVYNTAQSFLSATVEQRLGDLVELADPMSAVPHQMEHLLDLEKTSDLDFVSLHADDEWALAVTTDVVHVDEVYDEGRKQGPLVITLVKRDDLWLVTDVDLETQATAEEEVERFYSRHPNAVEIPLK